MYHTNFISTFLNIYTPDGLRLNKNIFFILIVTSITIKPTTTFFIDQKGLKPNLKTFGEHGQIKLTSITGVP